MGICSSCLGRRGSDSEHQATARLLYDEPYRSRYGTVQPQHRAVNQPDPELLRREREALETICHEMSDEVVDIFTAIPQTTTQNPKAPASPPPEAIESEQPYVHPDMTIYRSIKREKAGPIVSVLKPGSYGWDSAKTAIVGSGAEEQQHENPQP